VLCIKGPIALLLMQCRVELTVMTVVTAVLLHQCSMAPGPECSVVGIGCRMKLRSCLKLLQYCSITVLWIQGLTTVLLVRGRS